VPRVILRDIRKRFDGVIALDGVSLSLEAGRVHGLLGENGAGKTTLMNVLCGLVRPDSGRIEIDGRIARIRSPRDAIAAGVGMVHQHFMLAGGMTVIDNVLLGESPGRFLLDRRAASARLADLAERIGLCVDPLARVETLSVGAQQRVEIVKAICHGARTLILDEPTAVLTPPETAQLFAAVRRLRDQGACVVFISHKLPEVQAICDDLTILRRGRVAWEGRMPGPTAAELARHMVGKDVVEIRRTEVCPTAGPPILEARALAADGLEPFYLELGAEIVGVAGVDGNGQRELAEALVGLRPVHGGGLLLDGRDLAGLDAAARFARGVAHIPNDRKQEGLVGSMSIAENLSLKRHASRPFSAWGWMRWSVARRTAQDLVERFDIRGGGPTTAVSRLSGGNQQKVILARELALAPPRLVVAMNPTRGLDIAAANFVYERLLQRRREGSAILLISSELDELLRLADRIAVLYRGRLTMTRWPEEDVERIGRLMAGLE